MNNPFETGHIKNYILLYASVVLIMILFFIASTLFHDVKELDKKTFKSDVNVSSFSESNKDTKVNRLKESSEESRSPTKKFRLLEKAY